MDLTVRPAREADGDAVAEIYNQGIEERQATFETRPRTGAECAEQIGRDGRTLVAELDGQVVGWAGIVPYSARAAYAGVGEFSIYVDRAARRTGAGRRLLEDLCTHGEALGYHKLLGKIFPANAASLALVRSCGFREVGLHERHARLDGEWRDVVLVERLLGPAGR
jgi:L-amino acid N-acyltransferase YncA